MRSINKLDDISHFRSRTHWRRFHGDRFRFFGKRADHRSFAEAMRGGERVSRGGGVESVKIVNIAAGARDSSNILPPARSLRDVGMDIEVHCADSEDLDANERSFIEMLKLVAEADLVIVRLHSDTTHFKKWDRFRAAAERAKGLVFINSGMPEVAAEVRGLFKGTSEDYGLLRSYIELGGGENERGLLLWACRVISGLDVEVPPPQRQRTEGIYHPDHPRDVDLPTYLGTLDPARPTVGVMFFQGYWLSNDLEPMDALIRELERIGANVIPVFFIASPNPVSGSIGIRAVVDRYFMDGNASRVDAVILNMGFSQLSLSTPGDGSVRAAVHNFFGDLNVPVLQAMTLWKPRTEWEGSLTGLGAVEISTNVVWPEYDGQIIAVPIACTETAADGKRKFVPMPDRIERVASMAKAWGDLRRTPVAQRKVAILLYMYPPKNDRVGGAAGLDTFESVASILRAMKDRGYTLDRTLSHGKELLDEIMKGVTNDVEWLSSQEIKERAADSVEEGRYRQWFDAVPARAREAMCRDWGQPPGELYNVDGRLIVPGVRNGNVFIGFQPNRGYHAQAETLYHSTDVVMPHQYLAYYRWLKEVFGAHAIIHMGCHGTLEWLPGKNVGLSKECYPDVVLGSVPNLNPYIMDNPGEGVQAKRRSSAAIVDHLIPAMTRAGSYDELMDLDADLQAYLHAANGGQGDKARALAESIHGLVRRISMLEEIGLSADASPEDLTERMDRLYDYVLETKDALIKDGLHIMGRPPEGARLEEMLYSLTRLQNGPVPSLRAAVAGAKRLDLRDLQDHPSEVHLGSGALKGSLLDEVDGDCHRLLEKMMGAGFEKGPCLDIVKASFPGGGGLLDVALYICDRIYPDIMGTKDEIGNLLRGLDGGYVPPGPSGCPTRGNAHLLPTGRNFYSIDPNAIPGPACWELGRKMADQMVGRHVKEMGCYPKNVGMVVWATDTMKTGGDDIAYILWLMGLRPKWSAAGGRVTGLEVIPLPELGRPRIDVTLRISGLFRDTFPNLIDMIDEGVETIASLDESDEENYLAMHLREDIQAALRKGLAPREARARAMVRIFGDPPGDHGAGVDVLIESSKWSTTEDLAETYVTWGCHAYGREWRGEKVPEVFKEKLSRLNVTVKNHEDREFDLLDIDDDYTMLGGMNAAVRAFGGRKPLSIMGDSSDPQRLKTRTVEEESKFVFRSRVLNPKWLDGLKEHGFRGAQELSKLVEYVIGWDATSDIIEPWMYRSITERFLFDEETRKWIEESNPYALREMASRLLEAIQRGLWEADEEMRRRIQSVYLDAETALEEINEPK